MSCDLSLCPWRLELCARAALLSCTYAKPRAGLFCIAPTLLYNLKLSCDLPLRPWHLELCANTIPLPCPCITPHAALSPFTRALPKCATSLAHSSQHPFSSAPSRGTAIYACRWLLVSPRLPCVADASRGFHAERTLRIVRCQGSILLPGGGVSRYILLALAIPYAASVRRGISLFSTETVPWRR